MSKPKRNDPCPCGSGKKYKKCCGGNNVVAFNPGLYNKELEKLEAGLLEFAITNFESELIKFSQMYVDTFVGEECDKEAFELYLDSITSWLIFNEPIDNGQTIFDFYYAEKKDKITRTRTQKIFSSWGDLKPAVYEIISIDDLTISKMTVQDVETDETYELILDGINDDSVGNFLIGILLPFVQTNRLFYAVCEFLKVQRGVILGLLEEISLSDKELNDVYPEFLAQVIVPEAADELEWLDPRHEMVSQVFANHMLEEGLSEVVVETGVLIWGIYCQRHDPSILKPGSYAAALTYLILKDILGDTSITQAQIGRAYDVSAGTVSTNYRRLVDGIEDLDIPNLVEEIHQESPLEPATEPASNQMDKFNMEKEMRSIQQLLDGQDFESMEEMNDFINQTLQDGELPPIEETPRDLAQNLLYEAENQVGRKQKESIEKALDIYPNSPDAYLLLADNAANIEERYDLLKKAVDVGEADLGKDFFNENKGYFWGLIETRPYMRAKAQYARLLEMMAAYEEAVVQYEALLELNPNDNQGIRDLLLPLYIKLESFSEALDLLNTYQDDVSAAIMFNRALVTFLIEGIDGSAYELLKKAHEQNPFVMDYLLQRKKVPNETFSYIMMGEESEAVSYVQENMHLWEEAEALLQKLKK